VHLLFGSPTEAEAARVAIKVAAEFWDGRAIMQATLTPLNTAIARAAALVGRGTVVLTDAADATSSGASGNGPTILGALADAGRVISPDSPSNFV
jgi:microcystin degradation protein MlrC